MNFPLGAYELFPVEISTFYAGDVHARAWVRYLEIRESIRYVLQLLNHAEKCAAIDFWKYDGVLYSKNMFSVSMVEGWRGEVLHAGFTDSHGAMKYYKVVDPSFHNWFGLAMALRGQQISDFPLCNKSFNLSYCGHDL